MNAPDLLLRNLRNQVRRLQELVNYLEEREEVRRCQDDYSHSQARLREVQQSLKAMEQFSSRWGASRTLHAEWLN